MTRLRFLFDEEEEKEEEKFGWKERTRGIGELPEYKPISTKLKFTADVGIGAKAVGGIALPKPVEVPPLAEGPSKPEVKPEGLFQDPKMIELQKVNFKVLQQWFKELKESKNKWDFLKGEDYSPELTKLKKEYTELAPHMYKKSNQWIQATSLATISVGLASELIPLVAKATPEMLRKILYKVGIKDVNKKELHTALYNVTKGTDTPHQREIYEAFIKAKEIGIPFAERLKGVKITTVQSRFAFGTKLYAGLPADEIVKSIVEVGKVTTEMVRGLDPVKITQITQQLLNIEPALASEFSKVVAKAEVEEAEAPKVKGEIIDLKKELAGRMTKERIFLEEIEEAVGQKIDIRKPEDIQIALDYVKKVKEEVVKEEISKVEPKEPAKPKVLTVSLVEKAPEFTGDKEFSGDKAKRRNTYLLAKHLHGKDLIPQDLIYYQGSGRFPTDIQYKLDSNFDIDELQRAFNDIKEHGIKELTDKKYIPKIEEKEFFNYLDNLLYRSGKGYKYEQLKPEKEKVKEEIPKVKPKIIPKGKFLEAMKERISKEIEIPVEEIEPTPEEIKETFKVEPKPPIEPPIKPLKEEIAERGRIIPEKPKAEIKAPEELKIGSRIKFKKFYADISKGQEAEITKKYTTPRGETLLNLYFGSNLTGQKITRKGVPLDVVEPIPKVKPTEPVKSEEKVAGVIPKPEVKREVEAIPKVELATPTQIKEAELFAKEHKLITKTPSGKISDLRYKRLAKNMTGKTSVKDMTKEEADEFIESIKSIVQRRPWEPPIIPLSTKIVPKEFFEMEFKEPDISKIITPKKYYLRILGAEPLLKSLTDSMELLSLRTGEVNKWVSDVIKRINKEAIIAKRFKARIFNRPTDKVATMRDLFDKYENPPNFLKPQEKEIFKEVRGFTKDMLVKTNEVRNRVGLEPIKEVKTYIPHFLDELAKQIVNKKYPFPEDVKYWLGRNMPEKIYNPTAIERQVRDDLENFFSKDLGALLRTLAKYDLRDIYLSEPYSILRAELNALGDRIPANLRKEIDLFLRHDIFNYPTDLDQALNKTLEKPTDVINFFLKPLNRTISNPIGSLSNVYRQGLMGGAIAMKPRLVLRNLLTQKLLNMNLYPVKDYLRAQFWKTPEGVMEKIRDTTFYKLSIRKFEDLPPLLKPVQWGMYPYSKSHAGINYISNVDVSGKVGYYYGEDMIDWCETTKGKAYIEKYAKKHNLTGKAKNDLIWRKGDEIEEAVEAMSLTQWLYFSTDMPRVFRGKGARAFWSLQSWWMNWFGKHLREGLIRMGGRTSRGRIVRPGDRINLIKGLLIILGLTEAVRKTTGIDMKRFLFFPFPTYIFPPAMQLILNTYYLVTANTDQKRNKAISGLKSNLKLLIPFSGAWKRYWQFIKGEITLKEWLFYMEKEKKKTSKAPIVMPKEGKLEFTEPKIDIESDKLKFNF